MWTPERVKVTQGREGWGEQLNAKPQSQLARHGPSHRQGNGDRIQQSGMSVPTLFLTLCVSLVCVSLVCGSDNDIWRLGSDIDVVTRTVRSILSVIHNR